MFCSLFFFLALWGFTPLWAKTKTPENPVEPPLKIGAFNIQKLGISKLNKEDIMETVKKILLKYDIVLLQELVTVDESRITKFIQDLNKMAPEGTHYLMALSERVGRHIAKEQYAYLYRAERLQLLDDHIFPDRYDEFMRPPYIAHFSTPTLRDLDSLIFIGIHTQPKNAANETSALASVYDYAIKHYKQKNAVLMGDMNAGCSSVRISDWDTIDLWTREEFLWLITHDMDTTISTNCCPYDRKSQGKLFPIGITWRIVVAGEEITNAVILESVQVFNFRKEFDLSPKQALEVSDHWPIEVELRGKVSESVSQYLTVRTCVSAEDSRPSALPPEVQRQKNTMGFRIERSSLYLTLEATNTNVETLLTNLNKLTAKYPVLISRELTATISYKARHGALNDESSHDDLEEPLHSVIVDYDETEKTTSIHFCTVTTPN